MRIRELLESKQKLAYHATPKKNAGNILSNGLTPSRPRSAAYPNKRVYHFPSIEAADAAYNNWLGDRFSGEDDMLSLLSVDIAGLKIENDQDEYYTTESILPDRIKLVDADWN